MATCINGHAAPDEAAFCPTCGARIAPVSLPGSVAPLEAIDRPLADPQGDRRERRHAVLAAAGAGLLVLALAVTLLVSRSNGGSPETKSSPSKSDQTSRGPTPHEICVNQLFATVADIADNAEAGFQREIRVNGVNDPFVQPAGLIATQFRADEVQVGTETAKARLMGRLDGNCSENLNDQIRPNFPTDGTYPGQQ